MGAPLEPAVSEFGAGALWAILQALALSTPAIFGVHEVLGVIPLLIFILLFQFVVYEEGAPNAAVQLGTYVGQVKPMTLFEALRMVIATMFGSIVGSVFASDMLLWLALPKDGLNPPTSSFLQDGNHTVLILETATSLLMCAFCHIIFPKSFLLGMLGFFVVPIPAVRFLYTVYEHI